MTKLYNKSSAKGVRRCLRRNMPPAESILWLHLRNKRLDGSKFRRQYSIGKYVVDFYCPKARLVIEIDGPTHLSKIAIGYDQTRQQQIESYKIRFLCMTNTDIYDNIEGVLDRIITIVKETQNN